MAVLGSIFVGSWAASGSGAKPKTAQGPPINASSKEEGDFIQYVPAINELTFAIESNIGILEINSDVAYRNFLKEVDGGDKKAEKH